MRKTLVTIEVYKTLLGVIANSTRTPKQRRRFSGADPRRRPVAPVSDAATVFGRDLGRAEVGLVHSILRHPSEPEENQIKGHIL
jgi:hypothetical protein